MGGSGGTRTEVQPRDADIAPELRPFVNKAVEGSTAAMDDIHIRDFVNSFVQGIPDLTPEEQQWIQQIFGWAGDPGLTQGAEEGMDYTRAAMDYTREGASTDPFEQLAGDRLSRGVGAGYGSVRPQRIGVDTNTRQMRRAEELAQQLTGGEVGSSPATLQAMKAWEELVRPTVMAGQAITGTLGGGATQEALAQGKTAALTPLLAEEISTREEMAQLLGQLGLGASGQELQASTADAQLDEQAQEANQRAALTAAGLDLNSAAQLAAIGAGRQGRKLQAGDQKLRAGGQLAAIGTEKANLKISAMTKALEAAGMSREVAKEQAAAVYNDFLRRQGLAEQLYLGPTGNFLAGELTPGSLTTSKQTGGGLFGS